MEEKNLDSNMQQASGLEISAEGKQNLLETSKWAIFFTVLGFIGIGLMILGGLVMFIMSSTIPGGGQLGFMGIFYLIFAVLYIFPVIYLMRFSNNMKSGLTGGNNNEINEGFANLKQLFRYTGVMTIVIIGLYILVILIAMAVGISQI
jgi:hypothetical protein